MFRYVFCVFLVADRCSRLWVSVGMCWLSIVCSLPVVVCCLCVRV